MRGARHCGGILAQNDKRRSPRTIDSLRAVTGYTGLISDGGPDEHQDRGRTIKRREPQCSVGESSAAVGKPKVLTFRTGAPKRSKQDQCLCSSLNAPCSLP